MIFRIDPASDQPLFEQLVTQVRVGIARGRLVHGERLPAARELADALEMNVHTVLRAYQVLRDEGLIDLRRGRGAIVTGRPEADLSAVEQAMTELIRAAKAAQLSPDATAALVKEAMR
ncbi:GntR family transcriptional regulator [Myceligenerans indicum]|uniref:GntR family transcriptional regulator n=1 Tax=Myceligenerans indicum TaxID=2593663 RepID=A0ABS1LM88_9MICO|nr:GntR family transcriptional regulator [Myceligenerans indicum]MBL0887385.1 GntR family transcriptional regulator [Myceligenerans indicum]